MQHRVAQWHNGLSNGLVNKKSMVQLAVMAA